MIETFIKRVMDEHASDDFYSLEQLSPDQKFDCCLKFLDLLKDQSDLNDILKKAVYYSCHIIPHLHSQKRYYCISRLIKAILDKELIYGKEIYKILDCSILRSIQPLEIINLANFLSENINCNEKCLCETSLWGLVQIIPYMHSVNQREFADNIFCMHKDTNMRSQVLEALVSLIYSMDKDDRFNLILFFADILKKDAYSESKFFTLDLLAKVTPALPETDRLLIADQIVPLVFFNDVHLVEKSIEFFSHVINLLPVCERFHYTQIVSGFINDLNVRDAVIETLEKTLPFLGTRAERNHFSGLLRQFNKDDRMSIDDFGLEQKVVYYYEN